MTPSPVKGILEAFLCGPDLYGFGGKKYPRLRPLKIQMSGNGDWEGKYGSWHYLLSLDT